MQPAMIPISMIEERRRHGLDKLDEVWDGVLHMVPPPSPHHQSLQLDLAIVLKSIAATRNLAVYHDVGLYDPAIQGHKQYRIPDISVVEKGLVSARGIEGAAHIAIEIRSPNDESYEKLDYYAAMGVREVWIIDPQARTIEVYIGTRQLEAAGGVLRAPALGLDLSIAEGRLILDDGTHRYDVDLG